MPDENFIKQIKNELMEIIDKLANAGYITDIEYNMNMKAINNIEGDGVVVISLKKPEKRACRECGHVHGEYRTPQDALRIATDISMPGDCRMAAQLYIEKKLEEKND